jgi:hypothetical protein
MCLGVNALALVLNVISKKLGCQRLWWLGVFIVPNHLIAVGQGCWRHCSLSDAPPHHPTVRVRSWVDHWSFVFLRYRTVRCHTGQSGAPLTSCSDFCFDTVYFAESTVGVDSRCSAGSPDSPVNYSGARLCFPESGWLTSLRSWCTEHCPVAHRTVQCAILQHTQVLLLL